MFFIIGYPNKDNEKVKFDNISKTADFTVQNLFHDSMSGSAPSPPVKVSRENAQKHKDLPYVFCFMRVNFV